VRVIQVQKQSLVTGQEIMKLPSTNGALTADLDRDVNKIL